MEGAELWDSKLLLGEGVPLLQELGTYKRKHETATGRGDPARSDQLPIKSVQRLGCNNGRANCLLACY